MSSGEMIAALTPSDEIGWVLSNAREHAADRALRSVTAFAAAVTPAVHRSQIWRWESGTTAVGYAQVRQYETLLGLPSGQLLTAIDVLTRRHDPTRPGPALRPGHPATMERDPASDAEVEALLDVADSPTRMTGWQWRCLVELLGRPGTYLRTAHWEHLLRRCLAEAELSTGLEYLLRDEAKHGLAGNPRCRSASLAIVDEVLSDAAAPTYGEALVMLSASPGADPARLLVRHLEHPVGERAHASMLCTAHRLLVDDRLPTEQRDRLVRHAWQVVDDGSSSARVQRAAATVLELAERQSPGTVRPAPSCRRRIGRILTDGSALSRGQLGQVEAEVIERLQHHERGSGGAHPVLRRLLHLSSSQSAEDARGFANAVLMLSPQGAVVGATYAAALHWAVTRREGAEMVVDEALSVLSWVLPPSHLPCVLNLAMDRRTDGLWASQALVAVGNCRPSAALAPPGYAPDAVVELVEASALRRLAAPSGDAAADARGHLYALAMYGRFDVIESLAPAAREAGAPAEWEAGVRAWAQVPAWVRPLRVA